MNYAVESVFDDDSQNAVNEMRKLLDDNGVHDEALKSYINWRLLYK